MTMDRASHPPRIGRSPPWRVNRTPRRDRCSSRSSTGSTPRTHRSSTGRYGSWAASAAVMAPATGAYSATWPILVGASSEHMRQHARLMEADHATEDEVRAFHLGEGPPVVSHFVAEHLPT